MLPTPSLRSKIVTVFTFIAVIAVMGGGVMFWHTYRIDTTLNSIVEKEFVLYKTAQDMEMALANQKGFLTYYFVDGNGKWLRSLGQYRQVFDQSLTQAQTLPLTAEQRQTLNRIAEKYRVYTQAKDVAIENYKNIDMEQNISRLHEKQRNVFFDLLTLCQTFSQDQWQVIRQAEATNRILSQKLRMIAFVAIALFTSLCILFLWILYKQILVPIRGLAIETGSSLQESSHDEVYSLKHSFEGMMRDIGETSDELARSRKHLMQAERMAMVGELAAGVAHTIRNPFTSIKMRMFSLGRSLKLTEAQNEDLQVISNEISRIDRIVENFLEFARPPKLRLTECSLSDIINSVLILLEHRLKAYLVEMVHESQPNLPKVRVDVDRIKEALVNVVINACEAMEAGGCISITETRDHHPELGDTVVITICDNGSGIPEKIIDKVTAPFFTTKEDGSGLGLSIVARIVREHNGRFVITSTPGVGTQCIFQLPTGGHVYESDSDN